MKYIILIITLFFLSNSYSQKVIVDFELIQKDKKIWFKLRKPKNFQVAYLYNSKGIKILTTKEKFIDLTKLNEGKHILRIMVKDDEYLRTIFLYNIDKK
jgi:hypothetical protein